MHCLLGAVHGAVHEALNGGDGVVERQHDRHSLHVHPQSSLEVRHMLQLSETFVDVHSVVSFGQSDPPGAE